MATQKKQSAFDPAKLIESLAEFKETKNIDRTTLVGVLEECFRSVIAKINGTDENYDVILNPDKGDLEIYQNRVVVADGEVKNPNMEISLSDARKIDEDYEEGEEVSQRVEIQDFGRRAILTLRQTLAARILELEHDTIYNKFKDRVGEVVNGEVYQSWKRETLVTDDENNEMILPKTEQVPGDFFRKGETLRAVISKVNNLNGNPKIIISRTDPMFLQRLLEAEVPEIHDGLIAIRKVARIPGERAKVAVESFDERIDPVGACVGVKGNRVHGIVRELHGENIDVLPWTSNTQLMITRALSPARVNSINMNEEEKRAEVLLDSDQISLAIGKGGANIKLASMLTGYTIDVYREIDEAMDDDDISLDQFNDDIDQWIIDVLKSQGLTTARQVLGTSREDLINKTDLEDETIDEIIRVLSAEFEK
jgi:N utilization substance protein A